MSQGTIFTKQRSRDQFPAAFIKHYNLDIKIVSAEDAAYQKNFPLAKVPAFIGPKGFKLTESLAIAIYLTELAGEKKLLGKNSQQYAEVLRWMSLTTSEVLPTSANAFKPLIGLQPFNKKLVDDSLTYLDQLLAVFESRLSVYTFLVGERLSLADFYCATLLRKSFENLFGAEWRKSHPATSRWFATVIAQPLLKETFAGFEFIAKRVEFVPPKKEKKQAAPKQEQPKKEAKKEAAPSEEAPAEKKPKHPLELLGKPKAPIDEWKRVYSNEETRETAIPWFWKNQWDPEDWSLWKVDYKYNDELTLTFMSNNLVGGFFNRLSASTKYMFGTMVVYGENNNNGITGFFIVRGQDHVPAFDVAPDWESYSFTKLEDSEENRSLINNLLAWDEPLIINGEKREIADGKVFK